jgi:protein involved in polysaccharide export with SLBB domain/ribosomal protein S20
MMKFFILITLIFMSLHINAQVLNETAAKAELEKRGISEQRFREELGRRGIDITKVPSNPQELLNIEGQLKTVLDDLEREAKNKKFDQPDTQNVIKQKEEAIKSKDGEISKEVAKSTKEIKKAVDKGATIEEAISETVQEKQKDQIPEPVTFGQQLFRDNNLKLFRTTDDSKPSKSYILGPGDVVAVSIFGQSSVNFAKEITKDGYIQPDRLPRYYLTGLTIEKAEQLLRKSLRNYIMFGPEEFQVSVTTARTVNVNIFGEVFNNGSFNISAVNSAFNALVAAGGPTNIGSVRKIKFLRSGQPARTIDVYKFFNDPSSAEQFYLQENDYIQVPVADKLVTIYGAVNRPYRYELLDNENLFDLVKYSGGLLPNAIQRNIQVTRVENDKTNIIDVNYLDLFAKKSDFQLKNGDIIKVNNLKEEIRNIVSIAGGVEEQGQYAYVDGMKIADLLTKAKLKENAIKDIAYLRRLNDDQTTFKYELVSVAEAIKTPASPSNILLKRGDVLTVRAANDFIESKTVKIDGAVRIPGSYPLSDSSLKVSDLLFLSGGTQEKSASFAYLFRSKSDNLKTKEYIYIDIAAINANKNSSANLTLNPSDSLYVYYSSDYKDEVYVTIEGAVRNGRNFLFNPSLSVKDAILMAGGLKMEAAPNRIDVYRIDFSKENKTTNLAAKLELGPDGSLDNLGDFKLQPFDLIQVRFAAEYELQRFVQLDGELKYPGKYVLIKDNTKISDVIEMAGGPTQEAYIDGATIYRAEDSLGFVVMNLKEAMNNKSSVYNLILQAGDRISIPKQNTIVSIVGATNYDEVYADKLSNQGKVNIAFEGNKSAIYYINNFAGGLDEKADKSRITVEHKNGKVEKVKHFLFFKTYPKVKSGSIVNVPYKREKPLTERNEKKDIDWGSVLKDSIAQATGILSLILLLRSID